MSSLTRRIQRTVKRNGDGVVVDARKHFGGRGTQLGFTNPKDPCRTGKRKARKARRAKPDLRPPLGMSKAKPLPTRAQVVAKHRSKMEWIRGERARLPRIVKSYADVTANVSRRHPDAKLTPGQHARRKAERIL